MLSGIGERMQMKPNVDFFRSTGGTAVPWLPLLHEFGQYVQLSSLSYPACCLSSDTFSGHLALGSRPSRREISAAASLADPMTSRSSNRVECPSS